MLCMRNCLPLNRKRRNNKIIIPTGDDCLKVNDRVIIVNKNMKVLNIDDIFVGGGR